MHELTDNVARTARQMREIEIRPSADSVAPGAGQGNAAQLRPARIRPVHGFQEVTADGERERDSDRHGNVVNSVDETEKALLAQRAEPRLQQT